MSLMHRPDTMQARLAEAEARIERLEAENARLREAGKVLADFLRACERDCAGVTICSSKDLKAARVFEEGR